VNLAEGAIGAIDCFPDLPRVQATAFYLMTAADAEAVFDARARENLTPRQRDDPDADCDRRPGFVIGTGWNGVQLCYLDEQGRANLRFIFDPEGLCHPDPIRVDGRQVRDPTVYWAVLSPGADLGALDRAWETRGFRWTYPDQEAPQAGC
jgi:hypothetical protein